MALLLFRTAPRGPFAADQHVHLLALEPLALRLVGEQRQRRLVVLASVAVRVLALLLHHLLLHALQPAVGDLQALAKMPRLALQLGEVLEHLVGGGLVDMAVVVGDKFDELLHRVELRARHGGAFRQGCRQPPPPRRFRGDEVEYGGDIMQIRGEAVRVEQGLAEATGHHYRGMLAVGGTSGIRIGLRPRRHR